ncbi:MAG: peptide deformylase [Oscillospiraceae bacterium]|jgi:peptide deformylase|nr:peptide deformylase [Oscillospiraceae bacterium]
MAIRRILTKEEDVLHVKCRPVEKFDDKLHQLLDDMIETLRKAQGVGLAAPQVGIRRRIAVIILSEEDDPIELINPVIRKKSGKQRDVEGCLSCPDQWGYVTRPNRCTVRAQDRNGEFFELTLEGLGARCACHEIDHLDGKLFLELVEEFVDPSEEE